VLQLERFAEGVPVRGDRSRPAWWGPRCVAAHPGV